MSNTFSKIIGAILILASLITTFNSSVDSFAEDSFSGSSSSTSSSLINSSSKSSSSISDSSSSVESKSISSAATSNSSSEEIISKEAKIPDSIKLDLKIEEKIKSCISKKSNSQNEITIVNVTEVNGRLAKENTDNNIQIGVAYLNKAKNNKKLLETITYTFKVINNKVKCNKIEVDGDSRSKPMTQEQIKEGQNRWKEFNRPIS
jgi:hypothetical protein